jgi:quinol monooxygenase YgiN
VDVLTTFKERATRLVLQEAEAGRRNAGNARYDVLQWEGHENHFTLVAVWSDATAFDVNAAAPRCREFRRELTPLQGALYDERLYRVFR